MSTLTTTKMPFTDRWHSTASFFANFAPLPDCKFQRDTLGRAKRGKYKHLEVLTPVQHTVQSVILTHENSRKMKLSGHGRTLFWGNVWSDLPGARSDRLPEMVKEEIYTVDSDASLYALYKQTVSDAQAEDGKDSLVSSRKMAGLEDFTNSVYLLTNSHHSMVRLAWPLLFLPTYAPANVKQLAKSENPEQPQVLADLEYGLVLFDKIGVPGPGVVKTYMAVTILMTLMLQKDAARFWTAFFDKKAGAEKDGKVNAIRAMRDLFAKQAGGTYGKQLQVCIARAVKCIDEFASRNRNLMNWHDATVQEITDLKRKAKLIV